MYEDTIAAISTAWGEAGIAIIRLSGPEARTIVDTVLKADIPLIETPPRFMRNGYVMDLNGEAVDQVLAVWFKAPRSYTGEEVAELHCHGGTIAAQKCLDLVICSGARYAEPGEFTKRAFLNNRIDLIQAEAVIGIIRSKSEEALRAATRSLQGVLSEFLMSDYEEILKVSAQIEVGLDFPEEDIPYINDEEAAASIAAVKICVEDLLDRCRTGYLMREGIRIALVGRPNVGKSSLLNAFLKESRAIVTAIPGTTRDVIEEVLTYQGIPLRLVDTAGIGSPGNEIEAMGVERSEKELLRAEMRLWIIDGSEALTSEDMNLWVKLSDLNHIIVINKADLPLCVTETEINDMYPESPVYTISAQKETGIEKLKDGIVSSVAGSGSLDAGLNVTSRQIKAIEETRDELQKALEALESGLGQDLAATCLSQARLALERVLGMEMDDKLLDSIFSQFCVGK